MATFFGKYRGTVLDNADPLLLGRLLLQVPNVPGITSSNWALPCLPFTGHQSGFFVLPAVGANVWVEFERGDPNYPIWVGGFWATPRDIPTEGSTNPQTQKIILRTQLGTTLTLTDIAGKTGGVTLSVPGGASISITDHAITLTNGTGAFITLTGSTVTTGKNTATAAAPPSS
jgi:uncharacterized protein involved in type VI secretion and phage assembly